MLFGAVRLHLGKLTTESCVRSLELTYQSRVIVTFLALLFKPGVGLVVYFHARAFDIYPSEFEDACRS